MNSFFFYKLKHCYTIDHYTIKFYDIIILKKKKMAQFLSNKRFPYVSNFINHQNINSLLISTSYIRKVTNLQRIIYKQHATSAFKKPIYITTPIFYVNASKLFSLLYFCN